MKIPRYWARERYQGQAPGGGAQTFDASGWSFTSLADARSQALARAKRAFDVVVGGQKPKEYEYFDRPVKEEILQTIGDAASPLALVTRNRYGALVLNTASVLFADVDFVRVGAGGFLAALALLFSRKRQEAHRQARIDQTRAGIEAWAAQNPARAFRLYRTCEGFRLLFTDRLYDPKAPETTALLQELKCDPLYLKLTQKQECFRARLSAKPWRCGSPRPPSEYPWADAKAEQPFRDWEAAYAKASAGFRACELVHAFGRPADLEAVRTIVAAHDRGTKIESPLPLA